MIIKKEKDFNKIKLKESEKGITLIALVITIIVLLILAAVSIAMLTGENGILKKASTAKEKHLIAQYEEELNLCIMEMQTDELGTLTMPKLIEKLPQYIQTSQPGEQCEWNTDQTSEEPTGTYKGYEFKVDKNKKAQITGKATGIMISCSVDPSEYTNQNVKATIKITCNEGIHSIKQTKPTEEETITASGTEKTIVKENIEENTTFEYEVIDSKGNKDTKIAQVTNIDKDAPTSCTITANVNDDGVIEVTATAEDAESREDGTSVKSGIGKYEYYVIDSNDNTTKYDTNKIENLASGTYSVYVIAYDKAGNSKQSDTVSDLKISAVMNNITAQMVAEHPETYYGLKVTNYTSKNGQNDWRIFYSDGEHIFLITGDYVDLSVANRLDSNTGMKKIGTKYIANWSSAPSSLQTNKDKDGNDIDSIVKTRFMATGYTLNSSNANSRCVSTLLNASNWESYKDNGDMAEYAIGGSTIKMWMDSWNNLYKDIDGELYCNKTNEYGYYVGTSSNPTSAYIYSSVMSAKDGYNNSLYYPNHESVSDGDKSCYYYWLASPAEVYSGYGVLGVGCNGYVNGYGYDDTSVGVRPVVSLNSGIKVNATDEE